MAQNRVTPNQLAEAAAGASLERVLGTAVLLESPVEVIAWSDEEGIRCAPARHELQDSALFCSGFSQDFLNHSQSSSVRLHAPA